MKVGVQRLAVVLPREEQGEEEQEDSLTDRKAAGEDQEVAPLGKEPELVGEDQQGPARIPSVEIDVEEEATLASQEGVQVPGGTQGKGAATSTSGSSRARRKGRKDVNYKE